MITIRRATQGDADRVHILMEKLDGTKAMPIDSFRKVYYHNLEDPDIIYLAVEIDGTVAAFGSLCFSLPLHTGKPVAEIQELIVDERSRGKSIGAQLVNAMMLLARDRHCCCLEVASHRLNKRSHLFYGKHGFALTQYKLTMNMEFTTD
jgi:GNAT superfamily N-acetyltransferase